jgi:hypothetical protein
MKTVLTMLLLLGCQTDEKQGGMGPTFAQATGSDRCEALLAAYCDRCDDTTVWSYSECTDRPEIDVDCEDTINLGSKYEDCMEGIEEGQCADTLPEACLGIVIVPHVDSAR